MWITRFAVMVSFLALGLLLSPDSFLSRLKDASGINKGDPQALQYDNYGGNTRMIGVRLAHLLSFATAWGMSLWVTFIGGIIMFNNLPRHQFGNLQSKMFPAYFGVHAVCSSVCLACFAMLHPWTSATLTEKNQIGFLALSLVSTLANILVFEPITTKVMRERHRLERDESIGNEVGLSKNREVAKRNPKLAAINKKFGMVHGFSSLANLFSFGGFAVHSWYLASSMHL